MALYGLYKRFASPTDPPDRAVSAAVQGLARALLEAPLAGVTDLIPAYASLYVEFDATRVSAQRVRAWLERGERVSPPPPSRTVELAVHYDGPDLASVAERTGLTVDEVVARHAGRAYYVYAVGFTPGLAFMGEVDPQLQLPRRPKPRGRVAAGSVAIAGAQTTVYPVASPGGWHLLGRTLEPVYDPHAREPLRLAAGDTVRFRPSPIPPHHTGLDERPLELLPEGPERPLLRVLEPGLLDLVVDAGRFWAGRYGFARSGPLDARSAALANRLVGNPPGAALLELNARGGLYEALAAGVLAFAGYGLRPLRNGEPMPPFTSFAVREGDRLAFAPTPRGCRGYLALAGGVESGRFLGSAAVDLKGRIGRALRAGDVLGTARSAPVRPGRSFVPHGEPGPDTTLRVLPGPQASGEALAALTAGAFTVVRADRMGVQLGGPPVPGGEVRSEGVPLGAVQVPPGGEPIVLLADRGTMGGYAKPAVLHPADLARAGQLRPGDRVRFRRLAGGA
ncbi:carboxyltransferase domain-containing protein [Truepera radiovictrix]|uniref:Allophanate hydrolase subunit 2 n=1 Tax=Truepera radiovictrix (strain DSM 17093 / CIP 108686 / LMG 22925 / RQ-24) TaxID=649638 RepID=D7CXP5_TRURR|nr:carboxyltransferase domain-containing protein [Truepera radiovictrix]ADI14647.1 Allophanate hydrolase subunit 2 [Truepera radiovictrix DSM 17093]WMT56802.1 carboxyltransferase domain-containing protein [Truepera radiovictrix]